MKNQSTIMYDSSHGRSKAQSCLKKIIDIISSGSSRKEKKLEMKKGLGIDLNLTLDCFGTKDDKVTEVEEEEQRELSEVIDLEKPEIEEKGDGETEELVVEKKTDGEKGYIGLLVEAARLISGGFKDETVEEDNTNNQDENLVTKRRKSKRIGNNSRMFDVYEEFEDISPIVKSKRGRNQVLPLKYRDSVLHPWKSTTSMRSFKRVSSRSWN